MTPLLKYRDDLDVDNMTIEERIQRAKEAASDWLDAGGVLTKHQIKGMFQILEDSELYEVAEGLRQAINGNKSGSNFQKTQKDYNG